MNPYEAPSPEQRTNFRRVWYRLAITVLILIGIASVVVLGYWSRGQARRDRSSGDFQRIGVAVKAYENHLKRTESKSIDGASQDRLPGD